MAEDNEGGSSHPIRLMNFVSEDQLNESKTARGERVEDGTAQRDRTLYEILKENKDKKDAEFNERFKHRPPKALDEDETEFLENYETSKRDYERQVADEEAQQLKSFQAAVAAQSEIVYEVKVTPPAPIVPEQKPIGKKNPAPRPLGMLIKVKPQAKKVKLDQETAKDLSETVKISNRNVEKTPEPLKTVTGGIGLVSYDDDSEDDD
ncbi:hypothetical protein ACFE04_016901 [Oxalis oulophora]